MVKSIRNVYTKEHGIGWNIPRVREETELDKRLKDTIQRGILEKAVEDGRAEPGVLQKYDNLSTQGDEAITARDKLVEQYKQPFSINLNVEKE